jgi:SPP1 family phage portal protein
MKWPWEPTETEDIIALINASAQQIRTDPVNGEALQKIIDEYDTSDMRKGVEYYFNDNDINRRAKTYYKDGVKVTDNEGIKPNNRIPHNWHKLLVDQKTQYLVGKPITFSSDNATLAELVTDLANEDFDDTMNELVKNASNKGKEWLHPYIDDNGKFQYVIMPAETIIPIYDGTLARNLKYVIHHYTTVDEDGNNVEKAEIYDSTQIYYYIKQDNGWIMDFSEEENPASHFYLNDTGYGWDRVPFVCFKNNEECINDLTFYKALIDEYDKRVSDLSNTFEDAQELIYILKGYEGQSLSEFMENLRFYRAVNVDSEGGMDTKAVDVPIDSSDKHLNRLEESIYTFGQGVNTRTDNFGNSPSGVALKFLYSLLDLKANHTERKFRKALSEFFWFFTEYLSISGQGTYDPDDIKMTFNRTMITNDAEKVTMAKDSVGIISKKTIVAHHPWVDDVDAEEEQIKKEQDEYAANLPPLNNDQTAQNGGDGNEPT